MLTKKTALIGAALVLAIFAVAAVYPAMAASGPGNQNATNMQGQAGAQALPPQASHPNLQKLARLLASRGAGPANLTTGPSLTTGQTMTLTSIEGGYWVAGNTSQTGNASGTISLTLTGTLKKGDTWSVAGNITIDGQTYAVTSGLAVSGPKQMNVVGEAQTANGTLLFRAHILAPFGNTSNAIVWVDFSNGTTEYLVHLLTVVS